MMNKIWSSIKTNAVFYGLAALAALGFLYMFLRRGGDIAEYERFRQTVENLRINRAKEQGKEEQYAERREEAAEELERVREVRRELENETRSTEDQRLEARNQLEDFLRRHGG